MHLSLKYYSQKLFQLGTKKTMLIKLIQNLTKFVALRLIEINIESKILNNAHKKYLQKFKITVFYREVGN